MSADKTIRFEWDLGNIEKPKKHGVENRETEEAFFNKEKTLHKADYIRPRC